MKCSFVSVNTTSAASKLWAYSRARSAIRGTLLFLFAISTFSTFAFVTGVAQSPSEKATSRRSPSETQSISVERNSAVMLFRTSESRISGTGNTPLPQQTPNTGRTTFRVRGFVVDKDNNILPQVTLTITNPATGYVRPPSNVKGNFVVYLPRGRYIFKVEDTKNHLFNLYQGLDVESDTSIKFMYFGRRRTSSLSADLKASPNRIAMGGCTTLTWSTNDANSVSIDQGIGRVNKDGSRKVCPSSTKTYTLRATNVSGEVKQSSLTVSVTGTNGTEPSAAIKISPQRIKKGKPVSVTWSATGASSVTIDPDIGTVESAGSLQVRPKSTTTYTLTASFPDGDKTARARVVVAEKPGPYPPVTPNPLNGNVNQDANANTSENANTDTNALSLSTVPTPAVEPAEPVKTFPSTNFEKILIALLALAVLAGLAWALPFLSSIPSAISSFFGGFGMIGQTDGDGDEVHCTLYSQPEVNAGTDLLVQVFAHLLEQADELEELAQELDPDAKKAISKALKEKIKRESVLSFKLMVPGIELDEDEQDIVWRGEPEAVEFIIPIPADQAAGNRFGRVFVYCNGNEIGKIPFRINIVPFAKQIEPEAAQPTAAGVMVQDPMTFVSYASRDKATVFKFIKLMDNLKYKFHLDIFDLEPGDRWEKKLYEFIGTDEVFLLFWSEAASQSEWVEKEAKLAKERMDKENLPNIVIYNLDGKAELPTWLSEIHVDRKWAEIIGNAEAQR